MKTITFASLVSFTLVQVACGSSAPPTEEGTSVDAIVRLPDDPCPSMTLEAGEYCGNDSQIGFKGKAGYLYTCRKNPSDGSDQSATRVVRCADAQCYAGAIGEAAHCGTPDQDTNAQGTVEFDVYDAWKGRSPINPGGKHQGKHIRVSLDEHWLGAYEGNQLVMWTWMTPGRPGYDTPVSGWEDHYVYDKPGFQAMSGWTPEDGNWAVDVWDTMYLLLNSPETGRIQERSGVAIHGTYWHDAFGSKENRSHGCINTPGPARGEEGMKSGGFAKKLYDWTPMWAPVEVVHHF